VERGGRERVGWEPGWSLASRHRENGPRGRAAAVARTLFPLWSAIWSDALAGRCSSGPFWRWATPGLARRGTPDGSFSPVPIEAPVPPGPAGPTRTAHQAHAERPIPGPSSQDRHRSRSHPPPAPAHQPERRLSARSTLRPRQAKMVRRNGPPRRIGTFSCSEPKQGPVRPAEVKRRTLFAVRARGPEPDDDARILQNTEILSRITV
jgi:hypothetical protein